jgi:hypothetical protein
MIKRINSLGRKRIAQDCLEVAIHEGQPYRFSASVHLPDVDWPFDANVVLDVYGSGSSAVKRFYCGTAGNLLNLKDVLCDGITGLHLHFSVKVIDQSEKIGRLLGIGHKMIPNATSPSNREGRRGILPIELANLGHQLWSVEFRDQDVFLVVNEMVPGLASSMRSDPAIYCLVYPQVIRQILTRAIDQNIDLEEIEDRWPYHWLSFGKSLHPEHTDPPFLEDDDGKEDWIEQVVSSFCQKHLLRDKFSHASNIHDSAGD